MSDKIYRYEWKGLKTGWDYRVDIYQAGDTELVEPFDVTMLPPGALVLKKGSWKFDEYPVSTTSVPMLEFEIDLDIVPDDLIYGDFHEAIEKPVKDINWPAYAGSGGTVYLVYIKYNGNETNPQWRMFFPGLQRKGRASIKECNNKVDVKVEHITRCVCDAFVDDFWSWFLLTGPTLNSREGLIELAYDTEGTYAIGHAAGGSNAERRFWLYGFLPFWEYLEDMYNIVNYALLRQNFGVLTMDLPLTTYYRQLYNGTGNRGAALNWNELMFVGRVANSDEPLTATEYYGGMFDPNDEVSFFGRFKNSFWDFLSDFYKESLTKIDLLTNSSFKAIPICNNHLDNTETITINIKDIFNWELSEPGNDLKKVSAGGHENVGEDIDHIESVAPKGNRNDAEYTLPIVFDNRPAACFYELKGSDDRWTGQLHLNNSGAAARQSDINNVHLTSLYYLDKPTLIRDDVINMPFRVHEFTDTLISADEYLAVFVGNNFVAVNQSTDFNQNQPTELCLAIQKESTKAKVQSRGMLSMFSSRLMRKFEFEIDFNAYTDFDTDIGFPWWFGVNKTFIFDPAQIKSKYSYIWPQWLMIGTELNFENETSDVALIPKTI